MSVTWGKTPKPEDCTCNRPLCAICPYHEFLARSTPRVTPLTLVEKVCLLVDVALSHRGLIAVQSN